LQYVPHQDRVIGFEDLGNNKTKPLFADKALTFMIRGIHRKFKQPVAFMFTNSSMKTPDLVVAIKEVIQAVQSTGLMVAALICDQASTNVAAINKLKMETKEIGIQHVAKWEHLTQLYELDKTESNIGDRINPKLTDAHIYVEKMKKMKVLHAAQVFSQRVGSIMKLLATWSVKQLDPSAVDTAKFCLFMDKLFDSVNGSMALPTIGKELRCAVTKTSCHWDFWKEALTILKSMKFDCRQNKVVSIKSWIETLEGANCETDNSEGILDSLRELVLLNDFEDVEENIETEQT
nr:hypothetical protein [Tanacetum cinerariifolium]